MQKAAFILGAKMEFLRYLKGKFPLYHLSNIFFRDIHYGVMSYLEEHGMKTSYPEAEEVAAEVASEFEKEGLFRKIDAHTWLLVYPEFALPRIQKSA